jgi:hypothetical protein
MFTKSMLVLSLVGAILGSASAQTTRTGPSAYPTSPTRYSSDSTSALSPCYSSINSTSPCYTGNAYPSYSAITPEAIFPDTKNSKPSIHSFTVDQAKSRIEANGYANVTDLKKDNKGIWRGKAMKDGQAVDVILNFDGKIDAN